MFFGLFKAKVKLVTVKKKTRTKKTLKAHKPKKARTKKIKIRKRTTKLKKRKPVAKKVRRVAQAAKTMPQVVGKVTHYFPHVKAGVILVTGGAITLGDTLHIKGHTTDFKQKVTSMQINNVPIKEAKPKQEIGLLVKSRVRRNDVVYKL